MKEDFISDKRRVSYLSATYSRIYRGQSVLIERWFWSGKNPVFAIAASEETACGMGGIPVQHT